MFFRHRGNRQSLMVLFSQLLVFQWTPGATGHLRFYLPSRLAYLWCKQFLMSVTFLLAFEFFDSGKQGACSFDMPIRTHSAEGLTEKRISGKVRKNAERQKRGTRWRVSNRKTGSFRDCCRSLSG